jgi:hypothetical protein
VNPQEMMAVLDEIGDPFERRLKIEEWIASGELEPAELAGPFAEWLVQNDPGMFEYLDIEPPEGSTNQTEQRKINETVNAAITDEESDGGRAVTSEEQKAAEEAGANQVQEFDEPRWIQDQFGLLSEDAKQRLVNYVNFFYGASFSSFEELAQSGYLDEPTAQNLQDVTAAVQDDEVQQSFSWNLPGGDLFTVRADEWAATQQIYGLGAPQLKALINIADKLDLRNGPTRLNWQPVVALAQATGLIDQLKPVMTTITVGGPGGNEMQPVPRTQTQAMFEQDPDAAGSYTRPLGENLPMSILRGEGLSVDNQLSFREVIDEFQKGLELFNHDPGMAYIYALDPVLATRLSSGNIPRGEDLYRLSGLVAAGGFKSSADWRARMVEMGFAEAERTSDDLVSNYLGWLEAKNNQRSALDDDGDGPSQEPVRELPDPATLNESMRSLYQAMFLEEPSEEVLAGFRAKINAAVQGAEPGESIDVGARAREFVRADSRYGELYGRKGSNVSDEEYQRQFRTAQQSMLGAEVANNEAVVAGMRSGKYQTTIGAAAGTSEAWDNSTFLGRLARVGQLVGDMT